MRQWFPVCIAILLVSTLHSQETGERTLPGIFPIALILEKAEFTANGEELWHLDWPLTLPPDAFTIKTGESSRISIESEELSLTFSIGPESRLIEAFPFMLNGRMAQVRIAYRGPREIREIALIFPSVELSEGERTEEDVWKLEVLEYGHSYPAVIRGSCGDVWYFISLSRGGRSILETWYDEEGKLLGAYSYNLSETGNDLRIRSCRDYTAEGVTEYHYDSRRLITGCFGPGGTYVALYYREALPRYWERRPAGEMTNDETGKFTLLWDEAGLLRRITSEPENAGFIDYRYEYTLDEKGNWIERREIRMTRQLGLLIPSPGTVFRRILEYGKGE